MSIAPDAATILCRSPPKRARDMSTFLPRLSDEYAAAASMTRREADAMSMRVLWIETMNVEVCSVYDRMMVRHSEEVQGHTSLAERMCCHVWEALVDQFPVRLFFRP